MDDDAVFKVGFSVVEGCSGAGYQSMTETVKKYFQIVFISENLVRELTHHSNHKSSGIFRAFFCVCSSETAPRNLYIPYFCLRIRRISSLQEIKTKLSWLFTHCREITRQNLQNPLQREKLLGSLIPKSCGKTFDDIPFHGLFTR